MGAEPLAAGVDDGARREAIADLALDEAQGVAHDEADVLAIGLLGDLEADPLGDGAGLGLVELAEREDGASELTLVEAIEHVGLVLGRIHPAQ
ncbi:hypothetical protein D3C86_1471340 [compost metagenome]